MNEKNITPFNSVSKEEYFFLRAILLYIGFYGYINYLLNPNEYSIGYADYVGWSRPLDDLLNGKIYGMDSFLSYGPLFVFIQALFGDF